MTISFSSKISETGYRFVAGADMLAGTGLAGDFREFADQWKALPADPYLTSPNASRFRRHGRVIFDANADDVTVLPQADYLQTAVNNSLFGDVPRTFAPIEWTAATKRLVSALARTSVTEVLRLPDRSLLHLHQVRIVGGPHRTGAPVPEGPHRDGFDFISIHLIGRDADNGGETTLTRDDGATFTMTLTQPMDSVYVDDRRYIHDTTPIIGHNREVYRDVLLVSFQPVSQITTGDT